MEPLQMLQALKDYWAKRKTEMLKRWDFYYGYQQRYYLTMFPGETEGEYGRRVNDSVIENHCAKTSDTIVGYLYGQPASKRRVILRILDESGEIVEPAHKFLFKNIWEFNNFDSFRIDMALMASVTGVAIVHKEFVDKNTGLPFSKTASKLDKKKRGTIRYDLWDSCFSMPVPYIAQNGEIYPRKLGAVIRLYSSDNSTGVSVVDRILSRRFKAEDVFEYFDGNRFIRASGPVGGVLKVETETTNPYGDISIPFTVVRNYGDPMYLEGESDLAQMMDLQNSLNELANDDRSTIAYHSFPLLVLSGGAKLPPNYVRKVNSALELDGAQDVKYLTWDNVLEASAKRQEDIRRQMTVVSGVSQLSRGNASDLGQVRSGAGLKTLFQADINAIGLKVPFFKNAEKELVRSTLAMWEAETGETIDYDSIEVEFPEDFVGIDEFLKAQTEQIEVESMIRSRRELVKRRHPEIVSETEIDKMMENIAEEAEEAAEAKKPEAEMPEGQSSSTPEEKALEQEEPE